MERHFAAVVASVWVLIRGVPTTRQVQEFSEQDLDQSLNPVRNCSASSSCGLAVPAPAQGSPSEQPDSPMEMGEKGRREGKGARRSETSPSEISDRPVVEAKPAIPPKPVPAAVGSGTIVFSAGASSSKEERITGGLYMIDGIDVVATLVPEEDAW